MSSVDCDDEFDEKDISRPYFFESDHVALKENEDYTNLLHAIVLLESQRELAAQDIEKLHTAQSAALADPLGFVERLQRGESIGLPEPQTISPLPNIQWEKYTSSMDFTSFGNNRHMTRNKKSGADGGNGEAAAVQKLKSSLIQGLESQSPDNDPSVVVVRGRTKDSTKPDTFNKLWTEEEQLRLEKLLVQFPPEEIESRRWSKIADALGNRTPVQVASRVQKYFLRLAKEGLPVPGRMPNLAAHSQRSHRHHRYSRLYNTSSTLLQSHVPPVWMTDEGGEDMGIPFSQVQQGGAASYFDEASSTMSENTSQKDDSSDDELYPPSIQNTPEYRELLKLKKLRQEKLDQERTAQTKHIGYKCDNCGCEPITGTRWHCIDCPTDLSYDFCDKCYEVPFQQDKHNSSHRLHPFTRAYLDSDYMSFDNSSYNYLDSNYMPAN